MKFDRAQSIASAVLYEGYVLYPYRASAVKNRLRFNWGVVMPRAYCESQGGNEAWTMRTECLLTGDAPQIGVQVRFLHLATREIGELAGEGEPGAMNASAISPASGGLPAYRIVPSLSVDGRAYETWQEADEREVLSPELALVALAECEFQHDFAWPAEVRSELLSNAQGQAAGVLIRKQQSLSGRLSIAASGLTPGVWRVSVTIENTAPFAAADVRRDDVLTQAMVSAHTILAAEGGEFVSLLDPPAELAAAAAACHNVGTWPVLAGEPGQRDLLLSSPIVLYDYPQVATESGGDYFDATEMDEMLALRVLTLTDEEKDQMRNLDDRTRAILERTESLPQEHWARLHGAIRSLQPVNREPDQ